MSAIRLRSTITTTVGFLVNATSCHKIGNRKAGFRVTRSNLKTQCVDSPFYTTRLALPPDYENVVDFMCEVYYKGEPIIHNIGLKGTEAPESWRRMMYDQVRSGLSIIAEDRDHCIIGAALNSVIGPSEPKNLCEFARICESTPIRRIVEFYSYIAQKLNVWERYCSWQVFEQSSLAVHTAFQGLGIARRLVGESWFLARDCSYPLFLIHCNSSYCAKICERNGWQMIWSIPFDQYVYDGEVVFKHVKEPHTMCKVFVDQLKICKPYCKTTKKCNKVTYPPKIN
ncbi:uncharacterized protein LOC128875171 [Hylaeus volcanicus]|uniref:uncharacterized protein LOC128875171 n=1 Tax=Hylaeus volcanicus TaxID=313075 RepID=UPI0023B84A6A|nr:uncharacterized protein LOC128875171 [Hylaeus volcanicus]